MNKSGVSMAQKRIAEIPIDTKKLNYQQLKRNFLKYHYPNIIIMPFIFCVFGLGTLTFLSSQYNKFLIYYGFLVFILYSFTYIRAYSDVKFFFLGRSFLNFLCACSALFYFLAVILFPSNESNNLGTYLNIPFPYNFLIIILSTGSIFLILKKFILINFSTEAIQQNLKNSKSIDYEHKFYFINSDMRSINFRNPNESNKVDKILKPILFIINPIIIVLIIHQNYQSNASAIFFCICSLVVGSIFLIMSIHDFKMLQSIQVIEKKIGHKLTPARL